MTIEPAADIVVVLTEVALTGPDVDRMLGLHADEQMVYHVIVPCDTERHVVVDLLDHLMLLDLEAMARDLRRRDRSVERAQADEALRESLAAIAGKGRDATGIVTEEEPLAILRAEVEALSPREVVVVTEPHAVEDTFHTDWASRARDLVGIPILHMYAGDWRLG
ncbi:MAG: hypothetical protein V9G08_14400 [Dermatophilaceae bacterium]